MTTNWRDGFADFWGQGADDIIGDRRKVGGVVKPDVWDHIWGRSQKELTDAKTTDTNQKNEDTYRARIETLNGTWTPGQTKGYYEQELTRLGDQRTDERYPKTPAGRAEIESGRRFDANTASTNKRLDAQLQLQTQQMGFQNKALLAQMQNNQQSRSFDREQSSADRNLTLQLANINSDLQDKRLAYDKETRRMDRRDRNIAQLMSGLGQLGGAFSL